MTFGQWCAMQHPRLTTPEILVANYAWADSRKQALREAAEAVQLAAMKTLAPPLDTADCALVDAIKTAIRNL
jgi:hypothetical protein